MSINYGDDVHNAQQVIKQRIQNIQQKLEFENSPFLGQYQKKQPTKLMHVIKLIKAKDGTQRRVMIPIEIPINKTFETMSDEEIKPIKDQLNRMANLYRKLEGLEPMNADQRKDLEKKKNLVLTEMISVIDDKVAEKGVVKPKGKKRNKYEKARDKMTKELTKTLKETNKELSSQQTKTILDQNLFLDKLFENTDNQTIENLGNDDIVRYADLADLLAKVRTPLSEKQMAQKIEDEESEEAKVITKIEAQEDEEEDVPDEEEDEEDTGVDINEFDKSFEDWKEHFDVEGAEQRIGERKQQEIERPPMVAETQEEMFPISEDALQDIRSAISFVKNNIINLSNYLTRESQKQDQSKVKEISEELKDEQKELKKLEDRKMILEENKKKNQEFLKELKEMTKPSDRLKEGIKNVTDILKDFREADNKDKEFEKKQAEENLLKNVRYLYNEIDQIEEKGNREIKKNEDIIEKSIEKIEQVTEELENAGGDAENIKELNNMNDTLKSNKGLKRQREDNNDGDENNSSKRRRLMEVVNEYIIKKNIGAIIAEKLRKAVEDSKGDKKSFIIKLSDYDIDDGIIKNVEELLSPKVKKMSVVEIISELIGEPFEISNLDTKEKQALASRILSNKRSLKINKARKIYNMLKNKNIKEKEFKKIIEEKLGDDKSERYEGRGFELYPYYPVDRMLAEALVAGVIDDIKGGFSISDVKNKVEKAFKKGKKIGKEQVDELKKIATHKKLFAKNAGEYILDILPSALSHGSRIAMNLLDEDYPNAVRILGDYISDIKPKAKEYSKKFDKDVRGGGLLEDAEKSRIQGHEELADMPLEKRLEEINERIYDAQIQLSNLKSRENKTIKVVDDISDLEDKLKKLFKKEDDIAKEITRRLLVKNIRGQISPEAETLILDNIPPEFTDRDEVEGLYQQEQYTLAVENDAGKQRYMPDASYKSEYTSNYWNPYEGPYMKGQSNYKKDFREAANNSWYTYNNLYTK